MRVNRDIRLIVHKTERSILLCYVDHHDKAYAWAERRRIERHPRTGAAQLVEIRERVEEVPVYAEAPAPAVEAKPPLFAHQPDDVLLSYGVPEDWLDAVRQVDEDGLFELAEHLPQEAAEALLDLAVGATPKVCRGVARHMRTPSHIPTRSAASGSWPMWTSCARLWNILGALGHLPAPGAAGAGGAPLRRPGAGGGSAGTGKTVVALHRAAYLARRDRKRACWSRRSRGVSRSPWRSS